ncbi:MAG: cell division protein ZapA [Flavobacteriaceae bacterium]|jgi:cell division protein ZapA|nr:cell division protein ZapA [Flavobacteriaceae bacterium]
MSNDEPFRIKISIADRVYPLTVAHSQEEALRSASKKIDVMIHQFEENYAVRDKQDVLAMCALQFASQNEQRTIDTTEGYNKSVERLIRLDEALDRILSK